MDEADKTRICSWRMRREKRMKKRQEVGHSGWGVFHLTLNSKGSAVVDVSMELGASLLHQQKLIECC